MRTSHQSLRPVEEEILDFGSSLSSIPATGRSKPVADGDDYIADEVGDVLPARPTRPSTTKSKNGPAYTDVIDEVDGLPSRTVSSFSVKGANEPPHEELITEEYGAEEYEEDEEHYDDDYENDFEDEVADEVGDVRASIASVKGSLAPAFHDDDDIIEERI